MYLRNITGRSFDNAQKLLKIISLEMIKSFFQKTYSQQPPIKVLSTGSIALIFKG